MIEEIKVYYECLEQAEHFIKPLIKKYFKEEKIRLIKREKDPEKYSKRVAPLIFWKDPDILITLISKDEEFPLLFIEFSNAVFTEDHELQRMDGLAVSIQNNCCYLKISSTKKRSPSGHGGNIDFNYKLPYSIYLKRFDKISFHIEWPIVKDNDTLLEVDKEYLSCPPNSKELNNLFESLLKFINGQGFSDSWLKDFTLYVKKTNSQDYVKKWYNSIFNINENVTFSNSSRLVKQNNEIILKLNRFGHAMDPERGMLSYYGTIYNKTISKMQFDLDNNSWYKDISKEKDMKEYLIKTNLKRGYDFLYCFLLGSGLYSNKDFQRLVNHFKENKEGYIEIDLTEFLNKNYLSLNKAIRTIFYYSYCFLIEDRLGETKIKFTWKKFNYLKDFSKLPKITQIKKSEKLNEDDVTYISVHNILKPNGHLVLSVSYPGAQGDKAILIDAGTGRRQKRIYIDIISQIFKITSLQENKPSFSIAKTQKDINKLVPFKSSSKHQQALSKVLNSFGSKIQESIKIGIGFWADKKFTLDKLKESNITDLDYFIYISPDKSTWVIWNTGKSNLFKKNKGKVEIPVTYEISSRD